MNWILPPNFSSEYKTVMSKNCINLLPSFPGIKTLCCPWTLFLSMPEAWKRDTLTQGCYWNAFMEKGFHLNRNYPADDHIQELLVFSMDRFWLVCDLLQAWIAVKSENCQYKVNSNERLLYLVCRIKLSTFSQCRYTYYNLMEKHTKAQF